MSNSGPKSAFRAAGLVIRRMSKLIDDLTYEIKYLEDITKRVDRLGNISLAVSFLALIAALIALYISITSGRT